MLALYHKHTEELIRHIEMLNALFKYATEGIVVVDGQSTIAMIHPTASWLFGYKGEDLVGNKIELLIPIPLAKSHVHLRDDYMK